VPAAAARSASLIGPAACSAAFYEWALLFARERILDFLVRNSGKKVPAPKNGRTRSWLRPYGPPPGVADA